MLGKTHNQNAAPRFWRSSMFLVDWDGTRCYNPASSPTYRGVRYLRAHHHVVPGDFSCHGLLREFSVAVAVGLRMDIRDGISRTHSRQASPGSFDTHPLPLYCTQGGSAAGRMARFPTGLASGRRTAAGATMTSSIPRSRRVVPAHSGAIDSSRDRLTPFTEAS